MNRVLVIDDERLVRELLRDVLSRQGYQVVMAENGPKGLDLFKQHKPDVTLLDLHMWEMNGIDVLEQIRILEPGARVIMLTGDGGDKLEDQARRLGVTDFLRKSISPQALMATVASITQRNIKAGPVSKTATTKPSSSKSAESNGKRMSILLVDDEMMICTMVKKFLSGLGYVVRTAGSGAEALKLFDQQTPDMVVLDMYMPGLNGLQLIRKLRERRYTGGIIALTGSHDELLLQEALNLGSVDVMGKPVDLDRLALAIEVGLTLSEPQ
jgi:DNA-binding response OmpR family regulator